MKTASISDAKNGFSALLERVRKGETVVITDRNRPIAQLAPLEAGSKTGTDAWLTDLERQGVIRRAKRNGVPEFLARPPLPLPPGASILDALLEERSEGR